MSNGQESESRADVPFGVVKRTKPFYLPGKFYKKESQEKTLLQRPDFFLLPSPHD